MDHSTNRYAPNPTTYISVEIDVFVQLKLKMVTFEVGIGGFEDHLCGESGSLMSSHGILV